MIYKITILSLLLTVPFAKADHNAKNARIQELKELISQKESEISNLGNIIAQKDKLLSELKLNHHDRIELIVDNRIKQIEKQNGGEPVSQENKNKIGTEVRKKVIEFVYKFVEFANDGKDIKGMLTENLLPEDEINCGIFKFYSVQLAFDQQIILNLIEKYEICIQENYALWNELHDLLK